MRTAPATITRNSFVYLIVGNRTSSTTLGKSCRSRTPRRNRAHDDWKVVKKLGAVLVRDPNIPLTPELLTRRRRDLVALLGRPLLRCSCISRCAGSSGREERVGFAQATLKEVTGIAPKSRPICVRGAACTHKVDQLAYINRLLGSPGRGQAVAAWFGMAGL